MLMLRKAETGGAVSLFERILEILDADTEGLDSMPGLFCRRKDISRALCAAELAVGTEAW